MEIGTVYQQEHLEVLHMQSQSNKDRISAFKSTSVQNNDNISQQKHKTNIPKKQQINGLR